MTVALQSDIVKAIIDPMQTIQVRVDEKTKKNANRVLNTLGLDMSTAIKMYLRQIDITQGIPFSVLTENGFTPEQEKQLIRESNATLKAFKKGKIKGYTSAKALMKDLAE